jgi:hypothetical protein
MSIPVDDTQRKQCLAIVEQIFTEAAGSRATEILFRIEGQRIQSFFLVDGQYEKRLVIPIDNWDLVRHILKSDYFDNGHYQFPYQGNMCDFDWSEQDSGTVNLPIIRTPMAGRRADRLEDVFRAFEDATWDVVKSIMLSILNLALEQGYNEITMELFGQVVEITYYLNGNRMTSMKISSDSYDALTRLIGENYFAFGFMAREFRRKEYIIRLKELNEDLVAPRIRLEIERLD